MPVIVASLAEAVAALKSAEPGQTPDLWSPPDAAGIHGVLWFLALQRELDRDHAAAGARIALDCGDRCDLAIEALRAGLSRIVLSGTDEIAKKVADIAAQLGGTVHRRP